ncbi:MAG TPA: hypothetical protein VMV18_10990, partial [bacterium]|nr:hypothetical protein [bacterium]
MRGLFPSGRERGSALVLVLIAVVVLGGLMAAGYAIISNAQKDTKIELELKGQAQAVAESGITEALSWFRRSPRQPVESFDPTLYEATPAPKQLPKGLVREFEVSGAARLWGRYEVTPNNVTDITADRGRGEKGSGTVWRIRSVGYVFVRVDPTRRFDEAPNRVVHRVEVETEFQRMQVRPPARSALLADRGDAVTIARGGRVRGANGTAITYRQLTGRPAVDLRAEVSSESGAPIAQAVVRVDSPTAPGPRGRGAAAVPTPPPTQVGSLYDLSELGVFGVRPGELETLADVVVPDTSTLTTGLPQLGIVCIDGDAVFDEKHPLKGGGVLYVNGNLTILPRSNASFFGAIYVAGNLEMDAPSVLSGSVVVRGKVDVRGT